MHIKRWINQYYKWIICTQPVGWSTYQCTVSYRWMNTRLIPINLFNFIYIVCKFLIGIYLYYDTVSYPFAYTSIKKTGDLFFFFSIKPIVLIMYFFWNWIQDTHFTSKHWRNKFKHELTWGRFLSSFFYSNDNNCLWLRWKQPRFWNYIGVFTYLPFYSNTYFWWPSPDTMCHSSLFLNIVYLYKKGDNMSVFESWFVGVNT